MLISALGEDGGLVIWEPVTGRTRPLAPGSASFVAARDGLVAWSAGGRLHLTDERTGHERAVAALPGTAGFDAVGAFSPDGAMLAALTAPSTLGASALVLVDVQRASVRRSRAPKGRSPAAVTPA